MRAGRTSSVRLCALHSCDLRSSYPWAPRRAQATSELCSALGTLALGAREPLRGLPLARGRHTRFADDGAPDVSPGRLLLRGVPAPAGSHLRFQD
jgi:hypothetical protein